MIISVDAENACYKIPIRNKDSQQTRVEDNFQNLRNVTCEKLQLIIHHSKW